MAYFKSQDGGSTWGSAQYVTWTSATFKATNSPPKAIVRGDTLDLLWFSRSPEWSLYRVRMSARGFFENPSWAFSKTDGEPRARVMRSFLAPAAAATAYGLRVNVGYADLTHLPWSDKVMASWYDCPSLNAVKTTLYSTVLP
jgi:hypothetical protein